MRVRKKERRKDGNITRREIGGKLARYGTVLRHVSLSYRLDFHQLVGCSIQLVSVRDFVSHKERCDPGPCRIKV
jgi:hypothetical protein